MKHIPQISAEHYVYVRLDQDGRERVQEHYRRKISGVGNEVRERESEERMLRIHWIDHDVWQFLLPDFMEIFGAEGRYLFVDGIVYLSNPLEPERTSYFDEFEMLVVQMVSECLRSMPQPVVHDWLTLMGRTHVTYYMDGEYYALRALGPFIVGGRLMATCIIDKHNMDEMIVRATCTISVRDIGLDDRWYTFDCFVEDDRLTVFQREGAVPSSTEE